MEVERMNIEEAKQVANNVLEQLATELERGHSENAQVLFSSHGALSGVTVCVMSMLDYAGPAAWCPTCGRIPDLEEARPVGAEGRARHRYPGTDPASG